MDHMPTDDFDYSRSAKWADIPLPDQPFQWKPYQWTDIHMRSPHGLKLRISQTDAAIIGPKNRRWWQFWKPKTGTTVLAYGDHAGIHAGDTIALQRHGTQFVATVNGSPILSYPPAKVDE